MRGRTTLVVSHRLSLARSAHRVVVIEDGRIVEEGDPTELLNCPVSFLARMARADAENSASMTAVPEEVPATTTA